MKTYILKKSAIALAVIVMFSSCTDLFDKADIKSNPNSPIPSQVGVAQLTTYALVGLSVLSEDTDNRIAAIWGGQLAGTSRQHLTFQIYNVSSGTFGWSNYYNTAVNLRALQNQSISKAQIGLGQVAEAFLFAKMAALYGDVPYTEAMDLENHPKPKYDGQAALYATLVALLDKAVTNLNAGGGIQGDFIYGGDATKWAAAARTLQARLYLHLKNYTAAATAASQGIASAADDMLIPHGQSQQVDQNLNYDFFVNSRPGDTAFDPLLGPGLSAYLPGFMCTDIATGVRGTVGAAVRNSKTDETGIFNAMFKYEAVQASSWDANVKTGIFQKDSPSPMITYYENQLIWAEALARQTAATVADPTAIAKLNNVRNGLQAGKLFGKTYSLGTSNYVPYIATDFAPGGAANPATGPNANKPVQTALLREIASEKFVILLMQYEAFNEMRRLAVATPVISLGIPVNSGTQLPARFIYPQNEINTNPNTPNPAPNQFAKLPVFQ